MSTAPAATAAIAEHELFMGECIATMDWLLETRGPDLVDLIVVDPPYFRVKELPWDHQWDTPEGFIVWVGELCKRYVKLLRPNGSIYLFASNDMQARVEAEMRKHFNVLNNITWVKGDRNGNGQYSKADEETLRSFFTRKDHVIFAEHYGADSWVKGTASYTTKCAELRSFLFEPLRAYLAGEAARAGVTAREVEDHLGNFMARHYFGQSQWELPTEINYQKIRELLNARGPRPAPAFELHHPAGGLWEKYHGKEPPADYLAAPLEYLKAEYEYLRVEYEYLRADFEELRQEYEELRRPFLMTHESQYTDVWDFITVAGYPGKHPCEKPADMLEHIILGSSRPGAVVLDSFFGSCSTGAAARKLGRRFVGIELDEYWFVQGRARLGDTDALLELPRVVAPAFSKRGAMRRGPAAQMSFLGE